MMALLAWVCRTLEQQVPLSGATLVMALFAAAAGTAAALLALIAARLTDDDRLGWLGTAIGCDTIIMIVTATIDTFDGGLASAMGAVHFLLQCVVVALLGTAFVAPTPPKGWRAGGMLVAGVVLVLVAGAAALGAALPAATEQITTSQPLQLGVALAWMGAALAIAVLGAKDLQRQLWRVGLGTVVIGLAHLGGVSAEASPAAELSLVFSSIHVMGIVIVVWGTLCLAWRAVRVVRPLAAESAEYEEERRLFEIKLARAAERDHELRNGLAGLAGATTVLCAHNPDGPTLGPIIESELSRLDDLLRTRFDEPLRSPETCYAVRPVLQGLVTLRRLGGMDVHLDVDRGLQAAGSSRVLAEVIANVLGNAAQHAPGAPVWISADRRDGRVTIEIRDLGPGVALGREQALFEPGVRGARSRGSGLGLHISRRLLAADNGTITIRPANPRQPGCTVVVEVPAVPVPTSVLESMGSIAS